MQFPNPFKKEKPAEQAAEAPRIEPQLGGEGGEPSPWDCLLYTSPSPRD